MKMESGTCRLETERLVLRRFDWDDGLTFYHYCVMDEMISELLPGTSPHTIEETQQYIKDSCNRYNDNNFYLWAFW